MNMEKVLVLAGGYPQIELIKQLKTRGYFVLLADWNDEPVAKKFCDQYFKASTLDIEAIKTIAIKEKVKFLITVCTDQALLTVAKVSEELGLPCYLDYKTALNVTNKQYMKEVFLKYNISTAKHVIVNSLTKKNIKGFTFPIISKPVDCNSSKGVIKSNNFGELEKNFLISKSLSRTNTAIVEEFIDGQEITIDVYVENGKAHVLSTSVSEKIKDNDKFIIYRTLNPANPKALPKIKIIAQQIADAFGLKNTPMLIQTLFDGNDVYVIEFSARTGGGVKYLLIKEASGFDVIKSVIDLTEGKKPKLIVKDRNYKYLVNEFIYCNNGTFDHLENFDKLKEDKTILDYYLFKWKGAKFDSISNSGDRVAGFTIVGSSIDEINKKHNIANMTFKVIDTEGRDIAKHNILIDIDFGY